MLKMPNIRPRAIIKSPFPFKYGQSSDDSEDDEFCRRGGEFESSDV